ncbi:Constitutive coactivator of peroxisome proliferator-activated receptor gamma [Armadillidium vulgare]|nr:Constitutive coactivator of peroxisome proliferator-activated receptor gamma [Armadillidium vulgare]
MGVRGLQSYLESHCASACYSVNLGKLAEEYQRKTGRVPLVVIDGMSCLRKLYGKLIWICGGQWLGYIEHMDNFVKKMRANNINMVFFFDGNTPERKRETWVHRRLENLKDVATYFTMIKNNKELEHGKHFFLPTGLAAFTPLILKDLLDCEVYTCLDECDKEVAEYAKRHGSMGILGQDSDYTIYNTAPYYFSINHLNLETLDTLAYDRASLSRVLGITVDQLPILSCLIGNDMIPQELLTLFHKQFLKGSDHGHGHRHHSRPPAEILIPKVASFISNQPPVDQLLNQLPQLAKAVFREESMANALGDGIKMYLLDLTGEEKYHPIDPEAYKKADIVEKVRMRHTNSELGRHLYTILRGEPYESSTTLEDYATHLPSNSLIYRPLRAKVYRILQQSAQVEMLHVQEWCMYNGNTLKAPDLVEPEDIPEGTPSLEELWEGSKEFKWRTFCNCIHPELCDTRINTFPDDLRFPVCLLFYLQCSQPRPIFKEWEIGAMVAGFLSPIRKDLNQIRAINLPRIDSRAVHLATVFVKGLVNLYILLAACDFPLDRRNCVPWKFWDGKVFQHMYLRGKSGARVEDLVDKREDLYKLYIDIKSFLATHTPQVIKPKSAEPPSSDSPRKRPASPSTSEVTATPPQSPAHPPNTLAISKNTPKSPMISPNSPRSPNAGAKSAKNLHTNQNKTPTKHPAAKSPKTPKKSS